MESRPRYLSRVFMSVVVATAVLLVGAATVAAAKDDKIKPDKDEVTNLVVTSGEVTLTGPATPLFADNGQPNTTTANIPLAQATVTQPGGEVLVISAKADVDMVQGDQATNHCDLHVSLTGISDEPGWDFLIEDMHLLARRGDPGLFIDDAVIPAPPDGRVYTLEASVWSEPVAGEFEGEDDVRCDDEEAAASILISFTLLRD